MTSPSLRPLHVSVLVALGTALFSMLLAIPATARADDVVVVLGIYSFEGDDEVARNVTGALRHAADQVAEWDVSPNEATLAQMSLAHGCNEEPNTTCLREIAETLGAQRLIYGTLRRRGRDFLLNLHGFNASSGAIEHSLTYTIPSVRSDIDDLREPARTLIARLSAPVSGTLRVEGNVPGASVHLNGRLAGSLDAEGQFTATQVPVGRHEVEVRAEGYQTWATSVTVAQDVEVSLEASLVEGSDEGGSGSRSSEGPSMNWLAIGLLGGGVVAFAVTIAAWARIDAIQADNEFNEYRRDWDPAGEWGVPGNVCEPASQGVPHGGGSLEAMEARAARVNSLCQEASAWEIVQYVFLAVTLASAGTGAALLIVDAVGGGSNSSESSSSSAQVSLRPRFGPEGASLDARIQF